MRIYRQRRPGEWDDVFRRMACELERLRPAHRGPISAPTTPGELIDRVVILRLRNMTAIDATGLHAIQDFADALSTSGRTLLLCGALPQPMRMMDEAEFHRHVGKENILPSVEAALTRAKEVWSSLRLAGTSSAPTNHGDTEARRPKQL